MDRAKNGKAENEWQKLSLLQIFYRMHLQSTSVILSKNGYSSDPYTEEQLTRKCI